MTNPSLPPRPNPRENPREKPREKPPEDLPLAQISLMGPVLFVAFAAALVMSLPVVLGYRPVQLLCAQNCCGALTASLLGILPVRMFSRQGLLISPALGFVIPLLGVFMGGLVGAILQMSVGTVPTAELRELANRFVDEYAAQMEDRGMAVDDIHREEWVAAFVVMGRYGVLLVAAGSAVLAGAVGLLAATIRRRIARRGLPPEGPAESDGAEEGDA